MNTDPDLDPIRIKGFYDKKKISAEKKYLSKTTIYISLGLYVQVQKKPSALKREHPALQNMKFFHFFLLSSLCWSFLPSWIRIRRSNNTALWPVGLFKEYTVIYK
jgi:hypothetical protein